MEVLSITNKAGGAREIRRSRVEAGGWRSPDQPEVGHPSKQQHGGGRHHLNLPHHQVGHPSKQQHGGGRHHLNLPHHQDHWSQWRYPCPVVDSRIPEGVRLAQRPRPSGSGGSSVDPA